MTLSTVTYSNSLMISSKREFGRMNEKKLHIVIVVEFPSFENSPRSHIHFFIITFAILLLKLTKIVFLIFFRMHGLILPRRTNTDNFLASRGEYTVVSCEKIIRRCISYFSRY